MMENTRDMGKALVGSTLAGLWRYRVGDYRIFCRMEDEKICIVVVVTGHRREVYKNNKPYGLIATAFLPSGVMPVMKKIFLSLSVFTLFTYTAFAAMSDDDFIDLCRDGSLQEISIAIKNGANVTAWNEGGLSPLLMATAFNAPNVVTALIEAGADVNSQNKRGKTPLMVVGKATPEIITVLVKAGGDVNARDEYKVTPLISAAMMSGSNPDVIMSLIKAGAEINARDIDGWTALMWAADKTGNPDVITALIEAGADAKARSGKGHIALDLAKENRSLRNTNAYRQLSDASR